MLASFCEVRQDVDYTAKIMKPAYALHTPNISNTFQKWLKDILDIYITYVSAGCVFTSWLQSDDKN